MAIISTHLNVKTGGEQFSGGTPSLPICRDGNVTSNDWAQCQRVHAPTQRPSGASTANPGGLLEPSPKRTRRERGVSPLCTSQSHCIQVSPVPSQSGCIQVSPILSKSVPLYPSQSHSVLVSLIKSEPVLLCPSRSYCVPVSPTVYQSVPLCPCQAHYVLVMSTVYHSSIVYQPAPSCTSQSYCVPVSPIVS